MNHGKDQKERIDENLEYIKLLSARIRPEMCPELQSEKEEVKTVKTPGLIFNELLSKPDPRFLDK